MNEIYKGKSANDLLHKEMGKHLKESMPKTIRKIREARANGQKRKP